MRLRDRTFQRIFSSLFVYNILFEDTEVDETFLGVDESSRVIGIAGAGCGIANHLSRHPRSIDAVDINRHHLALTALKASAAHHLERHEDLYAMFGHGVHPEPERVVSELVRPLPAWIQKHWRNRHRMFARAFYSHGLTSRMLAVLRAVAKVDASWLRSLIDLRVEERRRAIAASFRPMFEKPWLAKILASPLQLFALGVNFQQRERLCSVEGTDLLGFLRLYVERLATTDLERNWFAWYAIAGRYNHDCPDAVPPYLRRDRHERSVRADTVTRFHPRNLFDVLRDAGPNSWTHYTLCDAPDWMPAPLQRKLFEDILRTSQDGAVVLYRSVEEDSLPERLGLGHHFPVMEEATRAATGLDRTCQFRQVAFHRVAH